MIIVDGRFSIPEHSSEKFLALFDAMRTATITEPANTSHLLCRSSDTPRSFLTVELWRSRQALADHLHAEYTQRISADLASCLGGSSRAGNLRW